jgi:hypothetical protein
MSTARAGCTEDARPAALGWRLALLEGAFRCFNSIRVFAYLPTLWAIHASGDSSQHSLWTWCVWLGANGTMALWLALREKRWAHFPVLVSAANAVMCASGVALIVVYRI